MLRIALCDDEKEVLREISQVLKSSGILQEVDLYTSGESLVTSGKTYDVIFLDVDMKGIDGIQTARLIRKRDKLVKIVYLTAYEDYRDYAFSVHAFGYLVKPVRKAAILRIVKDALEYTKTEEPPCLLRFETEEGTLEMDVKDIYYFEYLNRKIWMKTKAGFVWMKGSITRMGERMESYDFRMPHKSFVVNLAQIRSLKGYDILLMDGSLVPLSQKKSAAFREALSAYLAKQI
ncbi:MAG: LytTR family DNA-binding domain-containing protein [Candidatus Limivivens sp.]|nr:LytTR family DNA-binding domain-containing protein [Candidatus Limivivens sp.]